MPGSPGGSDPDATLYGLHLTADPERAGAVVAFGDPSRHATVSAIVGPDHGPDPARALAQCHRLLGGGGDSGLADRQQANLDEVRQGLREAAGLPLLPSIAPTALARHVVVGIPHEADPSTFYAYVRGENTPIRWLPELRPVHHAALRDPDAGTAMTAAHLARWLLVPVGPGDGELDIEQAVLGVVKAGEYLGVRWRTDPARAAEYAALLDDWYGPDHDAYRPAFPVGGRQQAEGSWQ